MPVAFFVYMDDIPDVLIRHLKGTLMVNESRLASIANLEIEQRNINHHIIEAFKALDASDSANSHRASELAAHHANIASAHFAAIQFLESRQK